MTDTVHTGVHAGLRPTIEGLAGRARVDWRIGLLAAVGLAAAAGLATSWLIPRGPSTALQGLVVMATGLLIGATAGLRHPRPSRCSDRFRKLGAARGTGVHTGARR